jgi:TolB protein
MNTDGSGLLNLTNNTYPEWDVLWSPGGTRIAFVSDPQGNNDIFVVNLDGSGLTNLTNSPGDELVYDWTVR